MREDSMEMYAFLTGFSSLNARRMIPPTVKVLYERPQSQDWDCNEEKIFTGRMKTSGIEVVNL